MAVEEVKVPDLGSADKVEVIEIAVSPGDEIAQEHTLIVLESDKATMDVPSTLSGVVKKLLVKLGDSVSQGTPIAEVEMQGAGATAEQENGRGDASRKPARDADEPADKPAPEKKEKARASKSDSSRKQPVRLPDLGTDKAVEVIEIAVSAGNSVDEGQTLMTLEGDKATMDVPSPGAGKFLEILVSQGDKVKSGDEVAVMESQLTTEEEEPQDSGGEEAPEKRGDEKSAPATAFPEEPPSSHKPAVAAADDTPLRESEAPPVEVYAGPVVRRFARELGVDLRNVDGTGVKGRIQKDDVEGYVRKALERMESGAGGGIPAIPDVDFSQFGEVEELPLSKIARLTAINLSRSWLNVPAVTQFDDADITDLEAFRISLGDEAARRRVKLTPVAFLMVACARLLREHPALNRSWHSSGDKVIQKHYVHIGMAVDTPRGLLVPVIRDVNKKGLFDVAQEIAGLSEKARAGKLESRDMQGGSFSISSLGAIGGRGFTPIANAPEAAILGVSKASPQPVWDGEKFVPRTVLPVSLTYDHRLINGADGGRFLTALGVLLGDIRRIVL